MHDHKRTETVEQITISGDAFEMLRRVCAAVSNLRFPAGGFGRAWTQTSCPWQATVPDTPCT
jgi:predicted Zn-dependent protease